MRCEADTVAQVQERPVASQADLDKLIEFDPPISQIGYTGEWLDFRRLKVTFRGLSKCEATGLLNHAPSEPGYRTRHRAIEPGIQCLLPN